MNGDTSTEVVGPPATPVDEVVAGVLSLVYASSRAPGLDGGDLVELLDTCRRNNERLGLTGILVASDSAFLQLVEGPAATVLQVLGRIEADPRHHGLRVLDVQHAVRRAYAGWTMAFHDLDGEHLARYLPGYRPWPVGLRAPRPASEGLLLPPSAVLHPSVLAPREGATAPRPDPVGDLAQLTGDDARTLLAAVPPA